MSAESRKAAGVLVRREPWEVGGGLGESLDYGDALTTYRSLIRCCVEFSSPQARVAGAGVGGVDHLLPHPHTLPTGTTENIQNKHSGDKVSKK